VFQDDRAFGFGIEGQDRVSAKFPHASAEFSAGLSRKQVPVKGFTGKGTRNRPVRADNPQVEAKLLHDRQGKSVAPSGNHDTSTPSEWARRKAAMSTGEI